MAEKRQRRKYTDHEKAHAILRARASGNVEGTATALKIPRQTLQSWLEGIGLNEEVRRLVELGSGELADLFDWAVREMLLAITPEKLAAANLRDLMIGAGVGVDKVQLLRGLPSQIVQTVDMTDDEAAERTAALLARAAERRDTGGDPGVVAAPDGVRAGGAEAPGAAG